MKPKFNIGDMIVEETNFIPPAYCLIIGFQGKFNTQYHLHPLFDQRDRSPYYMATTYIETHYKKVEV